MKENNNGGSRCGVVVSKEFTDVLRSCGISEVEVHKAHGLDPKDVIITIHWDLEKMAKEKALTVGADKAEDKQTVSTTHHR